MARVHVIANQKGGAGKTTLAMNLAAAYAEALYPDAGPGDCRIMVATTDPQASSVWWSKRVQKAVEKAQEGGRQIKPLPFDYMPLERPSDLGKLKRHTKYDDLFVDSPGTFENTGILNSTLDYADDVIVPMETEALAFEPTTRTVEKLIKPRGIPFRIVLNKWDARDGTVDLDDTRAFVEKMGWPMSPVVVRRYKVHARAALKGQVVTQYEQSQAALKAQNDFYKLAIDMGYTSGRGRAGGGA